MMRKRKKKKTQTMMKTWSDDDEVSVPQVARGRKQTRARGRMARQPSRSVSSGKFATPQKHDPNTLGTPARVMIEKDTIKEEIQALLDTYVITKES